MVAAAVDCNSPDAYINQPQLTMAAMSRCDYFGAESRDIKACGLAAAAPQVITALSSAKDVLETDQTLGSTLGWDMVLQSLAVSERARCPGPKSVELIAWPLMRHNNTQLTRIFLIDALRDLGSHTASVSMLKTTIEKSPRDLIDEMTTARLIALFAGVLEPRSIDCDMDRQLAIHSASVDHIGDARSVEWHLDAVVDVLGERTKCLSSKRVAEALDSVEIVIGADDGVRVFEVYRALLCEPFPISVLCHVWCNREQVQLPLLCAGTRLLCLNSNLVSCITKEESLGCLVTTLLQLSRLGHAISCVTALKRTLVLSPRAALLALCVDKRASKVKAHLISDLIQHENILDYRLASSEQDKMHCRIELALLICKAGRTDLVISALAHQAVNPLARTCSDQPLLADGTAAAFAQELITSLAISILDVFHCDARFALCLAALDADTSGNTLHLMALLKHAMNDLVNQPQVLRACFEFVTRDVRLAKCKVKTGQAIINSLRNHLFGARNKCDFGKTLRGSVAIKYAPLAPFASHAAFRIANSRTIRANSMLLDAIPRSKILSSSVIASNEKSVSTNSVAALLYMVGSSITFANLVFSGMQLLGGSPVDTPDKLTSKNDEIFEQPAERQHLGDPLAQRHKQDDLADFLMDKESVATGKLAAAALPMTLTDAPMGVVDRPLSIAELMPAASETQPAVAPSEIVLDCVHMVFNNVSHSNLEAKVKDIAPLLHEEHFGWFANYLVVKRISTQPNFHSLYLAFLEKLSADEPQQKLLKCVISAVFHNIAKLLRSSKITTSTSERSLLKNLGSWLGQITLARNRPILQRQLDVKELLYQGYESGRLIAICPFVAKILEGAKSSAVFRPPNPWLMGLMAVLRDLYAIQELKMNIKFEIEVLSKHLGIKLDEVIGPVTLTSRSQPLKSRSPDFNVKRTAATDLVSESPFAKTLSSKPSTQSSSRSFSTSQNAANIAHGGPELVQQQPESSSPARQQQQHQRHPQPQPPQAQQQQSNFSEQTVIPNLASYITVSPQVASGPAGAVIRRVAPVAVDRAIREIIQPVVERSVTIACITTRELVAKDFATESDENRTRKAAQLMVSNLAGSLALVTCKEPLRVSIAKHLRALVQQQLSSGLSGPDQHEQHAVQTCAAENLDLGCMLIEKAATEKAIRDVDEALAPSLKARQKRFEYSDVTNPYGTSKGRYPAALPEALRPKATGLLAHQFFVYEAFQRVPRQTASANHFQHHKASNRPEVVPSKASNRPAGFRSGASGGAAALSIVAQQAASERASISIAELMDAYRSATAKLDSEFASLTNKMQGAASDVSFSQLRNHPIATHVGELLLAAARVERGSRDDAALAIAQSTFKAMCEQRALEPPVRLETLAIVLAAVADISAHLVRDEVANWIAFLPAHSDADRFLHANVLVRLLGVELLDVAELDAYLARNMDGGRSQPWLDVALGFVELSVTKYHLATFPADLQRIARVLEVVARQPHPPTALRHLVAALSADQHSRAQHQQKRHQQQKYPKATQSISVQQTQSNYSNSGLALNIPLGKAKGALEHLHPFAQTVNATSAAMELRLASMVADDPQGAREQVTGLLEQWIRVWSESPGSEKAYAQYLALLQQHAVPKHEQSTERFIRLATVICVESCVGSLVIDNGVEADAGVLSYSVVDAYAKLLILLVKYAVPDTASNTIVAGTPQRLDLLNRVLATVTRTLVASYDKTVESGAFDQRPYFRLLLNLLQDLNVPDPVLDSSNPRVLAAFATVFHAVQPAVVPGFAFSWLELVSHRMFMPNLLLVKSQRGWALMHRLLVDLFVFLEPHLRKVQLSDAARLLYKGTLRVLLVLLHDFPEFLSDYHFSFCDVIPSSCIQLRNLFLSAFPRSMRLPDPFTPNLKVDLLPEISQPPRILSNCAIALEACGLREPLDEYLQTRHPISFLLDLPRKLMDGNSDNDHSAASYNVSLVNSLVVHVGITAISQLHTKTGSTQQPITHSTPMDVFQHLMNNLDSEGRYFLLNAIANQLRYPNNHTHYFSCVLLYLFAEATSEYIQEQVTRVLLERLIVHRPHPWGLLITFIELIKNPRYSFWSHGFTHCATEIERVFESVARSCMGPGHVSSTSGDPHTD